VCKALIIGGQHYLPLSHGVGREDGRDLVVEARRAGYAVASTAAELHTIESLPAIGLFNASHVSYVIDRRGLDAAAAGAAAAARGDAAPAPAAAPTNPTQEPTLAQMTTKAMSLLARESPQGYFLMVEAGRIDHGAHTNDAAAILGEVFELEEAWAAARRLVAEGDGGAEGDTLLIVTSDHDCGGLSVGCCERLDVDIAGLMSLNASLAQITRHIVQGEVSAARALAEHGFANASGRVPGLEAHERTMRTERILAAGQHAHVAGQHSFPTDAVEEDNRGFARAVSRELGVGFTSHDHTGVDVGVYADGPGADLFRGVMDNSQVGQRLFQLLGLEWDSLGARSEHPAEK